MSRERSKEKYTKNPEDFSTYLLYYLIEICV